VSIIGQTSSLAPADNRYADVFNNFAETVVIRENVEARDGFQFVERTASMTEAAKLLKTSA
ncbi:hypothetical protein ACUOFC_39260, partial [Escherichia sp. TWPC-MK]